MAPRVSSSGARSAPARVPVLKPLGFGCLNTKAFGKDGRNLVNFPVLKERRERKLSLLQMSKHSGFHTSALIANCGLLSMRGDTNSNIKLPFYSIFIPSYFRHSKDAHFFILHSLFNFNRTIFIPDPTCQLFGPLLLDICTKEGTPGMAQHKKSQRSSSKA